MTGNDELVRQMAAAAESSTTETADAQRSRILRESSERAAGVANTPALPVAGRGRSIKRVVKRLFSAAVPSQAEFNVNTADAVAASRGILERVDLRLAALEANSTQIWSQIDLLRNRPPETAPLQAALASHDILLEELTASLAGLNAQLDDLRDQIVSDRSKADTLDTEATATSNKLVALSDVVASAADKLESLRGDIGLTRAHLEIVLAEARSDDPSGQGETTRQVGEHRRSELYARFENRFRGTREQVATSLQIYEDDLARLAANGPILDIGSGRGEWLSLLGSKGHDAYGVDTNSRFVDDCCERGLDVRLQDALEHLAAVPEGSLGAVTGFHIVEHLPFEVLIELMDRCMIALAPGGRILFETPNPTNLRVGAAGFYLDPTHLRPLHPELLQFVTTDRGFIDAEIRFLRPAREASTSPSDDATALEINWSLFGPQDYAILATRPGAAADT
ncbi:MAG: methyltransferase domain-containing protein [Actinomycetia bacterium]|nr:methyltransferase domain-containing protein [Actinomycetes bacterium]